MVQSKGFIDKNYALQKERERLAKRQLQLENSPSQIFLRSFSQTAPQQLTRGLVEMGLGLGDYYLLGGKRKQEADEAVAIPGLAPSFVEKNYPDIYARSPEAQARRQAKASREMNSMLGPTRQKRQRGLPSKPSQPQQGFQVKAPKKPVIKKLGPDRFGLEIEEFSSDPMNRGINVDETGAPVTRSGGKTYRIIDGKQKDKIMADYNRASSARKQYLEDEKELQQSGSPFVAPGDRLPSPEKVGQVAKQQAKEPTYGFESLQRSQQMSLSTPQIQMPERPSTFAPQQQFSDYTKAVNANRRKLLEETQKQAQNRKKDLQTQAESQLKRLYDFLPQVSSEELVRQKELLDVMIAQEPNGDTKQMLIMLRSQMPSEEFRSTAAAYIGKSGNRRWSKISKSLPTKINFQAQRTSALEFTKRITARIERLEQQEQTPEVKQEIETLKAANKNAVKAPGLAEAIPLIDGKLVGTSAEIKSRGGSGTPELTLVEFNNAKNYSRKNKASIDAELNRDPEAASKFNAQATQSFADYKKQNPSATTGEAQEYAYTMAYLSLFQKDTTTLQSKPKSGSSDQAYAEVEKYLTDNKAFSERLGLEQVELDYIKSIAPTVGSDKIILALRNAAGMVPVLNEQKKATAGRIKNALSDLD